MIGEGHSNQNELYMAFKSTLMGKDYRNTFVLQKIKRMYITMMYLALYFHSNIIFLPLIPQAFPLSSRSNK
jgi:hypothetical protein